MSVIIKQSSVPLEMAPKLETALTVKSIPPQRFGNSPKDFVAQQFQSQSQKIIHAFDGYKVGNKTYICLPFSFYYHHLAEKFPREALPNHPQKRMRFQGDLLPRQQEIREEALEILSRTGSLLLCLHTGFGKTIFTLYLASRIGLKVLVLCHRAIIIQQWIESAAKYLPSLSSATLSMTDVNKGETYANADILVANVLLIPKISRDILTQFGCVIVDEVHTICTEQFSKALFSLVPSYLIGLSATPFRSDGMDRLLELYIGPEMITRKMTRKFNAYRFPTQFTPEVEETFDGKMNWNAVLESQALSRQRNVLICKLVWYFASKRTILVLVKRTDHATELKRMLLSLRIDVDCFMGGAKQANYNCRVLIATYSKGGVGFDHPKLDMLITGADVEENFMQYLGRVFRRDDQVPIYVDLRDNLPVMARHAQTRLKICKDVGGTVLDFARVFHSFSLYTSWINTIDFDASV